MSNSTDVGSYIYIRLDGSPVSATFLILNTLVVLVGIIVTILNSIAVCTILQEQKWRDLSCVFLMNLAMSDTVLGISVLYNATYNLFHFKFFHECVFRYSCINAAIFSSVFMLLGLGYDRYLKIIFPFKYLRICTVYTVVIYVVIVWTCAVLLVVVPFATKFKTMHDDRSCGYFTVQDLSVLRTYASIMFMALLIQIFINVHLLVVASSKICPRQIKEIHEGLHKLWKLKWTWWKPAKTVIIIVGVNVVCIVPAGIFLLIALSGIIDEDYDTSSKDELLTYIAAPVILNSLANPLMYAYKIKDIRRAYRRLFCCQDTRVAIDSREISHSTLTFPLLNRLSSFRSSKRRSNNAGTSYPV